MAYWLALLDGDSADLGMLADALSCAQCQVLRRDNGFALRSDLFDGETSADVVLRIAREVACRLSGASMTLLGTRRVLEVGRLVRVDDDGREHAFLFPEPGVITIRGFPPTITLTRADGSVETRRPGDPLNDWMSLAFANDTVARALRIRARGPLDWDDLTRVVEVIQSGGAAPAEIPGAPSASQLNRLSQTANSVHAIGDLARHPGRNFAPPAQPLTLQDARALVDQFLGAWLRFLSSNR